MAERFPGYDVLAKRDGPSWNAQTRTVIDARLAVGPEDHRFFDEAEWATVKAVAARLLPQPADRPSPIPVAALIDLKLHLDKRDGYRNAKMPPQRDAWRRGLRALEAESLARHGRRFAELLGGEQDGLLHDMEEGRLEDPAWGGMPCEMFFAERLMVDHVDAYYSHPTAWNEVGFGGPASPRGYVRMNFDRRDPWEAAEAYPGEEEKAERENRRVR